jgi:hypothetical protein
MWLFIIRYLSALSSLPVAQYIRNNCITQRQYKVSANIQYLVDFFNICAIMQTYLSSIAVR